jgi:predicted amidohydrolase YtcJ
VSRDDDVRDRQDPGATALQGCLIGREWVDLRSPVGAPPQVGQGVDPVIGTDDEGCVLLAMAGCQPQLAVRCQAVPVAIVIEPQVVAIARPEVDHLGIREERDVDGVIRMVMAQEDVGHILRSDTLRRERIQDERTVGDQAGVGHDQGVAVPNESDAAADMTAVPDVARVEEVDGRHAVDGTRLGQPCHPRTMTTTIPADLVFRNGHVATMDRARRFVSAIAVTGGRISAVGTDADVDRMIGPRTRVIDLRGRSLTPGFGDAHVHPVQAGLGRLRCDLSGLRGLDAYLAAIASYAASHPDASWITGDGWSMTDFPGGLPHRSDLDRIVADRPVVLENRDGHTAWVNGAALERAGIDPDTPDPAGGRIERDLDGAPSGALHESAMDLVGELIPPPGTDDLVTGLRIAQSELHALGITHWQDANVGPSDGEVAYTSLARSGELTARVVGALWWERDRGPEQIDEFVERRSRTAIGRYAPTSVKLMQDGVLENGTGALLEPYLDGDGRPTDNRGLSMIDPVKLGEHVARIDALGFQPHFHAIGDRAVREALDAVEAARRINGPSDTRPHIAHIQVIHPDDIPRFAALDVVANAQPYWACHEEQMDELTVPFLGRERAGWQYPFASLLRAGARLAMGSDWSVSTANPLVQLELAVNRVSEDDRGREPFLPGERLDLIDALAAFTNGTAWVDHLETELGSIEIGRSADLVVLDRDLFDRAEGPIGDARVVATFIDGGAVHEAGEMDG